jgi:hypothetical protein
LIILDEHVSSVPESVESLLRDWGTQWVSCSTSYLLNIQPGPYSVNQGRLGRVHRIYDDVQSAFLCSCAKVEGGE